MRGSQCLTCGAFCGSGTGVLKLRASVDIPGSGTCVEDPESAARGHPRVCGKPEGEGGIIGRLRRTRWHCGWCLRAGGLAHHSSCHCRPHAAHPLRCARRTYVARSDARRSVCIFASAVLLACRRLQQTLRLILTGLCRVGGAGAADAGADADRRSRCA